MRTKYNEFKISMRILKLLVAFTFAGSVISYFVGSFVRSFLPLGLMDVLAGMGLLIFCLTFCIAALVVVFIVGMQKGRSW